MYMKDIKPPWAEHPTRRAIALLRERYANDDELLSAFTMLTPVACGYGETAEAMAGADELVRRTRRATATTTSMSTKPTSTAANC